MSSLKKPTDSRVGTSAKGGFLARFRSDRRGVVAIMFAGALLFLIMVVGGAIDYARWSIARSETMNALDAAVLAGGRAMILPEKSASDVQGAARSYYDNNKSTWLSVDNTVFTVGLAEVVGKTTSNVKTPFLSFAGIKNLPVNVTAKALAAPASHVEVALMLDLSGTMRRDGKYRDLKAAAKDLIDIVVRDDQSVVTTRVGLVPFAHYVKIEAKYFEKVTGHKAPDVDDPIKRTCIKERINGNRHSDDAPGPGKYFGYQGDGQRDSGRDNYKPIRQCEILTEVVPLTSNKTDLKNKITNMVTDDGKTAGHLGTQWMWYLLSPNWSSVWPAANQPKAYALTREKNKDGNPKLYKIAVLMTDGEFDAEYSNQSSGEQAEILCKAMASANIIVYTVGFDITKGSIEDKMLAKCASKPGNYYYAADGAALKAAFREIALRISKLRLSE